MNTHDIDIELPPLPPLYIAPSVEPVDYPKVAQALMDYARAAIEADRQARGEPGEIQCRIYHGTEQHRDYLKARFHSDAWKNRVSFEWQGHRWAYRYTHFDDFGEYDLIARTSPQPAEPDAPAVSDYEAAMADHRRLVRELDVLLNGDGAAEQASLCDIVAQVRREGIKIAEPVKVPSDAEAALRFAARVVELYDDATMDGYIIDSGDCAEILNALADYFSRFGQSAQPGEDIMVNGPDDVYTLPLQPSGMTGGPRFVVHVPAQHDTDHQDAQRYRKFVGAGLPITYLGEDYHDKDSLDAAIDATGEP